ncbi:MAG: hypothetical protein N2484_13410 [Clostridia bacterium]|nr:hypothetical protein [Clostridia bacterium]
MSKLRWNCKGALTVEACIALPVFLGFFLLLLFLIKISCMNILLDHAVNETAKQIATSAYPISFVNEYEDKIIEEYGAEKVRSLKDGIQGIAFDTAKEIKQNVLGEVLSGKAGKDTVNTLLKSAGSSLKKGIGGTLAGLLKDSYWQLKDQGKYSIVQNSMGKFLEESLIDSKELRLRLVEFPQGDQEFEACKNSNDYNATGLRPGKDFGKDDVVIQLEYRYEFTFPVFGKKQILFRHTAIEKGWLHGSNGVYTEKKEGLELEDLGKTEETVYVTRTGEKYHKKGCRYLSRSKIPINLEDAVDQGYVACKVCKP